jgi:probable rRNA maturation factor
VFPSREVIPLGDIVLAFQTIRRECLMQDKTLENHVIHLIVHGTLHLLGYDHMRSREAEAMEKLECDILAALGYPDPYDEKSHVKKIKH